jgi:hypothetical protein
MVVSRVIWSLFESLIKEHGITDALQAECDECVTDCNAMMCIADGSAAHSQLQPHCHTATKEPENFKRKCGGGVQ